MKHNLLFILLFSLLQATGQTPRVISYNEQLLWTTPPTKACHASTIVETAPGKLMVAWFGGTYEGAKDVAIYTATNDAGFQNIRKVVSPLIQNGDTLPCWNPVLFKSRKGVLYLFFKVGKNPREWSGYMLLSHNNGSRWSKPALLPPGFLGPVKNKPIELEDGVILCPSSTESKTGDRWKSHMEIFNENTGVWSHTAIDSTSAFGVIQPSLLPHGGKLLQALMRSKQNRVIESWSYDGGYHWSKMDTLPVRNPNSGLDATAITDRLFVMANSPLESGKEWFNGRNILELTYSADGKIWNHLINLEYEPQGEFSYPALITDSSGVVHIVYTYNRQNLKYIRIALTQ